MCPGAAAQDAATMAADEVSASQLATKASISVANSRQGCRRDRSSGPHDSRRSKKRKHDSALNNSGHGC